VPYCCSLYSSGTAELERSGAFSCAAAALFEQLGDYTLPQLTVGGGEGASVIKAALRATKRAEPPVGAAATRFR
jgi:hypothetical protein